MQVQPFITDKIRQNQNLHGACRSSELDFDAFACAHPECAVNHEGIIAQKATELHNKLYISISRFFKLSE